MTGKIEQAMKALRARRSRDASTREIADELGWPVSRTNKALHKLVEQGHVSQIDMGFKMSFWRLEADTPRGEI